MTKTQYILAIEYLKEHFMEDISTEQLLARTADYVRQASDRPFDESDAAEVMDRNDLFR